MAGLKISITDIRLFTMLVSMCSRMLDDENVPAIYKDEIQNIVNDKKSKEFKHHPKVLYKCDKRACKGGCNQSSVEMCNLTSDVRHAKHFEMRSSGTFVEKGTEELND